MNHPTREEWMSYLYDELTGDSQTNLAAHLAVCPECKAAVGAWRESRHELDTWTLPERVSRIPGSQPLIRWAAAAAIVLGIGFGVGRLSAPASAGAEQIRAALEPSLRLQLRQEFSQMLREELDKSSKATLAASDTRTTEMIGNFAKEYERNRLDDHLSFSAALDKLDSQRLADYTALKRDLDTVAVFSEAGLRRTQRQLVQLASYTETPGSPSDSTPNQQRN